LKPASLNREELNRLMTTTSFNATLGFKVFRVWKTESPGCLRPAGVDQHHRHAARRRCTVDARRFRRWVALFGQLGGVRQSRQVELKLTIRTPAEQAKSAPFEDRESGKSWR
jgi:hypothetical protein